MGRGRELAKARRRPEKIQIPDLSGMIVAAALRRADEVGFNLVVDDPPVAFPELLSSGRWMVAGQDPAAFAGRFRGDTVVVTLRREGGGGGAGDREPRTPLPRRRSDRALTPADLEEGPINEVPTMGTVHQFDPSMARGRVRIRQSEVGNR